MVRQGGGGDNARMPYSTDIPAAPPADIARHFLARQAVETDCSDVAATLRDRPEDIVVVDTRSREAYAVGHVPGAVSLPNDEVTAEALAGLGGDRLFVTYCWGPHCNGATKGAALIAGFGFAVKEMLGGVWGWEMEGYELVGADAEVSA